MIKVLSFWVIPLKVRLCVANSPPNNESADMTAGIDFFFQIPPYWFL
jgi:hypothetical protein